MDDKRKDIFGVTSKGVTLSIAQRASNENVLLTLSGFGDQMTIEMPWTDASDMAHMVSEGLELR